MPTKDIVNKYLARPVWEKYFAIFRVYQLRKGEISNLQFDWFGFSSFKMMKLVTDSLSWLNR